MLRTWIAGDCWLKAGLPSLNLPAVFSESPPDIFIFNLECSLSGGPERAGRRALLALDPTRLRDLRIAESNVAVLANNHVTDYGTDGLIQTIEGVRHAGLLPLGAAPNLSKSREPIILNVTGRRVGLLAYADTRFHVGSVGATSDQPGVAALEPDNVCSDVRRLAKLVDDVWIFLHWGREYLRYPEPEQRVLARRFVAAGATLIVGMHPHVLRGAEQMGKAPVFYSLGNFVFPPIPLKDGPLKIWDSENNQGLLLSGTFCRHRWEWETIPYMVSEKGTPELALGAQHRRILREFARRSAPLDESYASVYPKLERREKVLKTVRRLGTMEWSERLRLPARLLGRLKEQFSVKSTQGTAGRHG